MMIFFFPTFSDVSGNKSAALETGKAAGPFPAPAPGRELGQRADLSLSPPPEPEAKGMVRAGSRKGGLAPTLRWERWAPSGSTKDGGKAEFPVLCLAGILL